MTENRYAKYSIYVAAFFAGVYFSNLAYMKLLQLDTISPIGGFDGLINTDQVIVIFLMSIFFVVYVVHEKKKKETGEPN